MNCYEQQMRLLGLTSVCSMVGPCHGVCSIPQGLACLYLGYFSPLLFSVVVARPTRICALHAVISQHPNSSISDSFASLSGRKRLEVKCS